MKMERNEPMIKENSPLLTAIHDILFELDEDYTFRNIITSDDSVLLVPRQAIADKKIYELFPREFADHFIAAFQSAAASGQKEHLKYKSPFGGEEWYEASIHYKKIEHAKGKYIVSIREITKQKKVEDELEKKTTELERFFQINLDLLCIADLEGNFIKVNKAWEDILGYPIAELEKRKFLDFVHPEDMDGTLDTISRLGQNQQVLYFVNRYKTKDGSYRDIEWCSQPYDQLIYAAARDITGRMQTEEALIISERRLQIAMKATGAGLWDWDMKKNTVYFSQNWKSMLGYEEHDIEDTFFGWEKLWHPDDKERITKAIEDYRSGKTNFYEIDYRMRCKNGEWRWILTRGELMRDSSGEPYRWVGTNIDITYLKEAEERIRFFSLRDQLTGLYNRRFYEEELSRLDTPRSLPLSIILADINALKLANDTFGHLVGDNLLKKATDIIKKVCRSDEIICRIGGDESAIILPNTDYADAESLVDRIVRAAEGEHVGLIDLSISFGWATKIDQLEDIDEIFKKAEDHMYQRKTSESAEIRRKIIHKILMALYERLPEEESHAKSVSQICVQLGEKLGLNKVDLGVVKNAGLLHDIGKITLSEALLYKKEALDASEWIEIRRHAETGYRILNSSLETAELAKYVLHHHEHWNGEGYPFGLEGNDIPLQSRMIAIADAYQAMTSDRAYRTTFSKEEAIKEIMRNAGTQFDPDIAQVFLQMM